MAKSKTPRSGLTASASRVVHGDALKMERWLEASIAQAAPPSGTRKNRHAVEVVMLIVPAYKTCLRAHPFSNARTRSSTESVNLWH